MNVTEKTDVTRQGVKAGTGPVVGKVISLNWEKENSWGLSVTDILKSKQ